MGCSGVKHFVIFILASLCLACDPKATTEITTKESSADPKSEGINKIESDDWKTGKKNTYRLSDELVLAIPAKFQGEIGWKLPRPPFNYKSLPFIEQAGFSMFMPDFSVYTAENIDNEFHTDKVQVVWIMPADPKQAELGAPGYHVPNMFRNQSKGSIDPKVYLEKYGLRCYEPIPHPSETLSCFGVRNLSTGEQIFLSVMFPRQDNTWATNPSMQARYYSAKYGGTSILWRTGMKNFEHWEAIDAKIWQYIDAWNLAKPTLNSVQ